MSYRLNKSGHAAKQNLGYDFTPQKASQMMLRRSYVKT
jgi:hypothetical protein